MSKNAFLQGKGEGEGKYPLPIYLSPEKNGL